MSARRGSDTAVGIETELDARLILNSWCVDTEDSGAREFVDVYLAVRMHS